MSAVLVEHFTKPYYYESQSCVIPDEEHPCVIRARFQMLHILRFNYLS